jgi:hypothetical protein
MGTVGVVQLDSVNVLARAHYLPFFARLGPYDRSALDRWLWRSGEMFEYWAHEASLAPIGHRHLLAHRMAGGWHWPGVEKMLDEHPGLVDEVMAAVVERGPITTSDLDHHNQRSGSWWGWSNAKRALEYLFLTGAVTAADRPNFQRLYDLPKRVHPAAAGLPPAEADDARTELLAVAAAAHGIGTLADLADYHRIKVPDARRVMPRLVERGDVEEVSVEGWSEPAYLHTSAAVPRRLRSGTLLAPFDPLVWFRPRLERLFGFHYRIEIYTPAPKRRYGYYVLPFLSHGRLTARVDLKADRGRSVLMVPGVFGETGIDVQEVAVALAGELAAMRRWLGLEDIEVGERGDLAPAVGRAVESTG